MIKSYSAILRWNANTEQLCVILQFLPDLTYDNAYRFWDSGINTWLMHPQINLLLLVHCMYRYTVSVPYYKGRRRWYYILALNACYIVTQVVDWPKEHYGSFYSGDSYIILYTYKKDPKSEVWKLVWVSVSRWYSLTQGRFCYCLQYLTPWTHFFPKQASAMVNKI